LIEINVTFAVDKEKNQCCYFDLPSDQSELNVRYILYSWKLIVVKNALKLNGYT